MRPVWPAGLALAALLGLAGCLEHGVLDNAARDGTPRGPTAISVFDGQVQMVGPQGFCIDPTATRETAQEAFVLLVRCTDSPQPAPVLSASVSDVTAPGAADTEALTTLARYLATPAGLARLSRRGEAGDVQLESQRIEAGALWLQVSDRGNPEPFEPRYWRAILPLAERVVTLTVLSARDHPIAAERGPALLRDFAARMRAQNAR